MVRGSVIRRLQIFARRHLWDGVCVVLFAGTFVAGIGPVVSGAEKFGNSLIPEMAARASDAPSGGSVARLPMFEFASASPYSPQVLFPVIAHGFPAWLMSRGPLSPPPPLRTLDGFDPVRGAEPSIAICIDDLGEDLAGTDKAMALPKDVALSFLPYAEATAFLAQEAEFKGHQVLAHVPMEALSRTDPGPMTLKVGAPDIAEKIAWNIGRVPGLVGINNHEGSRFTQDAESFAPVARALAARHLFFFDSRTGPDSKAMSVAQSLGVMTAGRDIFLDDTISEVAVRQQLDALVAVAKHQGIAIAIGHPHDVTLKVLAEWLAQNHGVQLIPLSEALRRRNLTMALASR